MNIYNPFETQSREFEARVLFCLEAASKGHNSYLGHKTSFDKFYKNLFPGIFLHKSIQKRKLIQFNHLSNMGHINCAFDEEGLMIFDEEEYFGYRAVKECLNKIDFLFTWGDKDREMIIKKYPEFSKKVHSAGNSRIDILKDNNKYNFLVKKIKKEYGNFILINTKFCRFNVKDRGMGSFADMCKYNTPNLQKRIYKKIINSVEFERKSMNKYFATITKLSNDFHNLKFIIRPHPAENHDVWKNFAKTIKNNNVEIIFDGGSANPWMLAAKKVISYNCTTSIEAILLNINSINFLPIKSKTFEYELPQICAKTIRSYKDLKHNLLNNFQIENDSNRIKYYIQNSEKQTFCKNFLEIIENKIDKNKFSRQNISYSFFRLNISKIIVFFVKYYSLYFGNYKNRRGLYWQKFPGFSIKNIQNISNTYPKFSNISIKETFPGIFLFKQEKLYFSNKVR